ncbi:hypothetical protein FSP39_013480 [Pinctada imbricata]|uniref:MTOR-associated protein MEAK7 n=1 Tax=Pinctada imbricata TaxID=66713 RepID=A0AA88XRC0_PINIB|nr:hypothetical protein FSP39_013480 [Pinctada imbricata]
MLPKEISEKLFGYITHIGAPGSAPTLHQYNTFLEQVLKGTCTEKAQVLFSLCRSGMEVAAPDIFKVIKQLIKIYGGIVSSYPHFQHVNFSQHGEDRNESFSLFCLRDLFFTGKSTDRIETRVPEDFVCSLEDIEKWMYKAPLFNNVFDTVFSKAFPIEQERQLMETLYNISPIPEIPAVKLGPIPSILDAKSLLYLNSNLPSSLQSEWRLLFSNSFHGDSFSQLVSQISHKGPSLMIIREKGGHVFGGFASHSWECKPKYYGEPTCFLFSLAPHYGVYTATMYNQNFMYLNLGQETLPNGLGMGGQFEYCGFWIDDSYNTGHSKAKPKNTTYGSPQLSSSEEFEVEAIEVWAVGREPKSDSDEEAELEKPKRSILDRDPESKAMLELIGRHQASEGIRERDLKDEETEEMRKKMNTIPKLL